MWHCELALAVGLALSACEQPNRVDVVASPYADGVEHVEPIVYNGKRYDVSFRFQTAGNLYEVKVSGQGRKLAGTPGGTSGIETQCRNVGRHFACPTGQRGEVVAGSPKHGGSAWGMQVRCA